MRTKNDLLKQIEKSKTIIQIETLILEAAEKELSTLTTKANRIRVNRESFLPENSIHNRYVLAAENGNVEAQVWIRNQLF